MKIKKQIILYNFWKHFWVMGQGLSIKEKVTCLGLWTNDGLYGVYKIAAVPFST